MSKIQFDDCPHCHEPGLYYRVIPRQPSVLTCAHCRAEFTDEEAAEHDRQKLTDERLTRVYRGCTVVAFLAIVGAGLLVVWLIMDTASKG
jgi:hypothetical protein